LLWCTSADRTKAEHGQCAGAFRGSRSQTGGASVRTGSIVVLVISTVVVISTIVITIIAAIIIVVTAAYFDVAEINAELGMSNGDAGSASRRQWP
jgi:hypothetical protein